MACVGDQAQLLPPIPLMAYQFCVFTRHRKVEIAYTAISLFYGPLFFSFQKRSILIHSSNRHFGVSGDYYSRRQVWGQRFQNARYPSDDCSRRNRILLGYLHISLRARDDTTIGKGKHLYYRCRNDAEVSPAKSSALACSVSAMFDFYRWTYTHFPSHVLAQWK